MAARYHDRYHARRNRATPFAIIEPAPPFYALPGALRFLRLRRPIDLGLKGVGRLRLDAE